MPVKTHLKQQRKKIQAANLIFGQKKTFELKELLSSTDDARKKQAGE